MGIGFELGGNRRDHLGMAMAGIEHGDAAGKIHIALTLDVPEFGALGPRRIDRKTI